ncbi:MAG: ParB/RepB/Spo0J family partition protein [Clostridia bacterium]|nr:ParB/RepB/Spo0J family partition protein [Clostridia bacterium]
MKRIGKNLSERVEHIFIRDICSFPDHPFEVRNDDAMKETVQSVKDYGVIMPVIVRQTDEGYYEMISGHRRMRACELAGIDTIPAIVRDVDRDTAIIMMVDSNLQRENILPSEKAKAYKMKLEAIKRQGKRNDLKENLSNLTYAQVGHKSIIDKQSVTKVADETGESRTQIQRYIRLNELSPPLQKLVDEQKMGLTPAVEISYLKPEEQALLVETIESEQATPSLSQAKRMRDLSKLGKLNDDRMLDIMMEQKKPPTRNVVLNADKLNKYFPKSYTNEQIEATIFKLLDIWQKHKQQNQNR